MKSVFEKHALDYDEWFEINRFAYESEVLALRKSIHTSVGAPPLSRGHELPLNNRESLEVGVGTGRFALPLGVKTGVEPAKAMAEIARRRGINVFQANGENLPF